jgi:hypothetical protein
MRAWKCFGVLLLASIALLATGCSGGAGTPVQKQPPVSVFVTTTVGYYGDPEITTSSTLPMVAVVANTTDTAVSWSVSCASAGQCGSIAPAANSDNATYSSPSAIPLNGEVTITATSVADPTQSGSRVVVITGAGPIAIVWQISPPTWLADGMSVALQAVAQNDTTPNPQIQWKIAPAGQLAYNSSFTIDQFDGAYVVAPSGLQVQLNIPLGTSESNPNVTVTACSNTDQSKCASFTVSVIPAIGVSFSSLQATAIPSTFSMQLSASEKGDPTPNPQINWSLSCASSNCGSLSTTTTANNGANVYTAPAGITANQQVTITITDAADPAATDSTNLWMIPLPANPALPNGTYVFQLAANQSSQTGAFQVQQGAIYGGPSGAGEMDAGGYTQIQPGAYVGPIYPGDGLETIGGGAITQTADGNLEYWFGPASTPTFIGTPLSNGKGFIAESGYGTVLAGTLELESAVSPGGGGYAIGLQGGDLIENPTWFSGIFNSDNSNGLFDTQDGGESATAVPVTVSNVSPGDPFGRSLFQIDIVGAQASPYFAFYSVDGTHMLLEETNTYYADVPDNDQGVMNGEAFGQGGLTGNFSTAAVAGSTYVFAAQGTDSKGSLVLAGLFTLNADGTVNGLLNWGDGGNRSATTPPLPFTGTYTIDSMGRIVLSNLTDGSTFTYNMYFYVSADGSGVVFSNGASADFQGQAFLQQSGPFSASSLSGTYPVLATFVYGYDPADPFGVGTVTINSSGGTDALTGYMDAPSGTVDQTFSGSFTPSANGVFQGTLNSFPFRFNGPTAPFNLYLIDSTHGFAVETDATGEALIELRQ